MDACLSDPLHESLPVLRPHVVRHGAPGEQPHRAIPEIDGEIDVPLKTPIRLQFSREMNPDTFKGNVAWTFTTVDAVDLGAGTPREADRTPDFKYDRAKRSLEIRLSLDDSATYRHVILELRNGIAATDGAQLKPWQLTFVLGAQ